MTAHYRIGLTPRTLDPELAALAASVQTSTIGHWKEGGFAHGLRPLGDRRQFVGTALTVRLCDMDAAAVHYAADILEPGHVLVVDMGGDLERASVGAILTFLAHHKGATGIVIDGMATDLPDLERAEIPVFARGVSATTTRVLGIEGDVNYPVVIGGTVVTPGAIVIGDADGLLFLTEEELRYWAPRAIEAQESEAGLRDRLAMGGSIAEASGALAAIRASGAL